MEFPRLAVIGCGALASRRIYPYLGAAGARLVGACDLDLARAERNAALFGGRAYADWEAMLGEQRPDAVIVCIGPEQHAELAPRILRLGYPVYTEKPPAATSRDALAVARAAKETGLLCVTAFKKRYARCYERARQLLDEHPPEDRLALSIDYAGGAYREDSPRGTFLLDFCIHVLDLSRYLFGEVSEVAAFAAGRAAYAVSLRFACGAVGSLALNAGRAFGIPTEEVEITLRGGHWMTVHNSSQWRIVRDGRPEEWREPPTFTSAGDDGHDTGHLAELADFVDAIRTGRRTSRSAIAESYRSMALYEAIQSAADRGRPVNPVHEEI